VNYYNEIDANAAQWIRNLIAAGEISQGKVDERSILEVRPSDVAGAERCHWFAGIGGWDLALRLSGWSGKVWTASLPCQPFSSAGKGQGEADPRHLWPHFFRLVKECRPPTIFGEQVPAAIGLGWLDGVFDDLEAEGYACGALVLTACSVGAPHIRQRLYWVADRAGATRLRPERCGDEGNNAGGGSPARGIQHPEGDGRFERGAESGERGAASGCGVGGMGDDELARRTKAGSGHPLDPGRESEPGQLAGPWSDYRIIPCTDGRYRRTGRSVFPLVARISREMGRDKPWLRRLARSASRNRVGRLKGYGNAIVPALAAQFIGAHMEARIEGVEGK